MSWYLVDARATTMVNSISTGLQFRGAIAFSWLLIVAHLLIGFFYDQDTLRTLSTAPHYNHVIGYCQDRPPVRMLSTALCWNGLHPQSGIAIWEQNILLEHPLLTLTLILLQWGLPVLAAALISYLTWNWMCVKDVIFNRLSRE